MEWTKKYQPTVWEEMIGNKKIDRSIQANLASGTYKPILLYGEPGTGKTSRAYLIARTLLGENYKAYMLDINASKDNGVDVMRDVIAPRTHYKSITGEVQVILIDEADYLTSNAQASLRRIIEDAKNAQFIFVTNDLTKIINPLRDRCRDTTYHVLGVSDDEMRARINEIAELENMSNFDIDRIIDEADGSMRSAIKLLESYNNGSQYSFKTPTASLKDFMRGLKKVDIMSLLPCINADNLDNLARVILMNDKLTMEKRRAYVKFIADADIAIQHSHNADVHLINLIMNMKEC